MNNGMKRICVKSYYNFGCSLLNPYSNNLPLCADKSGYSLLWLFQQTRYVYYWLSMLNIPISSCHSQIWFHCILLPRFQIVGRFWLFQMHYFYYIPRHNVSRCIDWFSVCDNSQTLSIFSFCDNSPPLSSVGFCAITHVFFSRYDWNSYLSFVRVIPRNRRCHEKDAVFPLGVEVHLMTIYKGVFNTFMA